MFVQRKGHWKLPGINLRHQHAYGVCARGSWGKAALRMEGAIANLDLAPGHVRGGPAVAISTISSNSAHRRQPDTAELRSRPIPHIAFHT
jgi:hypothetical protein